MNNEPHTQRALRGGSFLLVPLPLEPVAASPINMDDDIALCIQVFKLGEKEPTPQWPQRGF